MGAGDKRTRRGKIAVSSYGNSRPHKPRKAGTPAAQGPGSARPAPRGKARG